MKITDIKWWPLRANWRTVLYLKVFTDEGIVGVGEATLERNVPEVMGALENFKMILLGQNPLEINSLWQRMVMYPIWRPGASTMTAVSGIEIALWDILGKALDVPVYRLLGGKVRDRIRAYSNGWFHKTATRPACSTIGDFAVAAAETIKREGYQALMWDPFGAVDVECNALEIEKAVACVRAVREAIGPHVDMAIEFHFKFDLAMAVRMCKHLEEFDPLWYEDPLRLGGFNVDGWRVLARSTRVPLMEGGMLFTRWDYRTLLPEQLVQHIKPDILHVGGLAETMRIAALAEMYGITCSPHNVGGMPGRAATLHFAASVPNFYMLEQLPMYTEHPAVTEVSNRPLPAVKGGYLALPEGPGLGVDLDNVEELAQKFPYEPGKDAPKLGLKGLNVIDVNPVSKEEEEFMRKNPPAKWSLAYS
jgi:galactonate dehydratase